MGALVVRALVSKQHSTMNNPIHVHVHVHTGCQSQCDILQRLDAMTVEMQRLIDEVSQMRTVSESVVTTLNTLSQYIRDHANDPEALRAMADDLDAQQADVTAAIVANTPPTP